MKHTTQQFIADAREAHGDTYDYTHTMYTGSNRPVTIICKVHGPFTQRAAIHTRGSGCSLCADRLVGSKNTDRTWNPEQLAFLRQNYATLGRQECARRLDRPCYQVSRKAAQLGLTRAMATPTEYKYVFSGMWNNILAGARNRGLVVEINERDVYEMYLRQNRHCALSGVPIVLSTERGKTTASVDRIDSSKGYVKGNIQIVHKRVNQSKMDSDDLDFYAMCKAIHEHRSNDFETDEKVEVWDELNDTIRLERRRVLGRPTHVDFSEEAIFGSKAVT